MRMRPMLKTQGAGGVFVFVRPAFALATVEGGKAKSRYKNCDSPAACDCPQASKKTAAGGLTSF